MDYFSNSAEVDAVNDATADGVSHLMKQQFARHAWDSRHARNRQLAGVCLGYIFRHFARYWKFRHITSCSSYPQSNVEAGNAIKTVNSLFHDLETFHGCHCWPCASTQTSPTQRLFSRRTETLLPNWEQPLQPAFVHNQQQRLRGSKNNQALAYNKAAKDLPVLVPGQTIHM